MDSCLMDPKCRMVGYLLSVSACGGVPNTYPVVTMASTPLFQFSDSATIRANSISRRVKREGSEPQHHQINPDLGVALSR